MKHSKRSQWLRRGAFTVVAFAAVAMFAAEQVDAQVYRSRGASVGSFGRSGVNISVGNRGYGYGRGLSYNGSNYGRGFSSGGFNSFNSGFRYVQPTVNRGGFYGGGFYGGGVSRGGFQPRYYSRGRY